MKPFSKTSSPIGAAVEAGLSAAETLQKLHDVFADIASKAPTEKTMTKTKQADLSMPAELRLASQVFLKAFGSFAKTLTPNTENVMTTTTQAGLSMPADLTLAGNPLEQLITRKIITSLFSKITTDGFYELQAPEAKYRYLLSKGFCWTAETTPQNYPRAEAESSLPPDQCLGLDGWGLPTRDQLVTFAVNQKNPWRSGGNSRLFDKDYWHTSDGVIDLDRCVLASVNNSHRIYLRPFDVALCLHALALGWSIVDCVTKKNLLDNNPSNLRAYLEDIDYTSCRLPKLDLGILTDPNKGLWEAHGDTAAKFGLRGRDPARDIRPWNVTIDFGTSSTVVAYDDDNGRHNLLRIGVSDFWQKNEAEHYENPTVLEILDFEALLAEWQATAYRPLVAWDHARCSHEALANWRDSKSDPRVVASILTKIKQWALREGQGNRLRLTDQVKGVEHELAPLTLNNPVRGTPLTVNGDYPFDPLELYAWFLGLNINWRGRGIFLKYYMTFPVAYPKEVKEKILASFRRGLQRSLPETLITQGVFHNDFSVEELASEPAAYAAIALPVLGIEPTTEGTAYGVFDFGGGTADFDFGLYRLPTAEEEDDGDEVVFEHFGAAGDPFLGGENLLEHLAYRVFCHNLDVCRNQKIAFSRPLDAEDFSGSEMFLDKTQAATTNTLMLMARLRPLWESGKLSNSSGVEKIDLISRSGQKITCELAIPEQDLLDFLEERIQKGILNFFAAMQKAFAGRTPRHIDVLLAGNASRSRFVLDCFGLCDAEGESNPLFEKMMAAVKALFGEITPGITAHPPLAADPNNFFRPTAKTGVALGLLRLCPGSPIKVINAAASESGGEAPFAYFVGRIRQGKFQVGLNQACPYDQWHEIGMPRDRVFNMYFTQSPRAHTGMMSEGENDLFKRRIDLPGNCIGKRIFARAITPSEIELCLASSIQEITAKNFDVVSRQKLG